LIYPLKNKPGIRLIKLLHLYSYFIALLVVIAGSLGSCNKFDGPQTIPAYLKIDTIYQYTNYNLQGENSHNITDLWIYLDDQQIGVFEIPAMFPILADGKHKLEIRPGVKVNGISSTRAPYPMLKPIVFEEFDFHPDSIQELNNLTFKYYDNVTFAWIEDFEQSSITIQETSNSDTAIKRTLPSNNPEAYLSNTSLHSGQINVTVDKPYYSGWSLFAYELPKLESPVILELDYKTDTYVTVGLFVHYPGGYESKPLIVLNHSDEWKHIYINFTPTVSQHANAIDYKVHFEAGRETGSTKSNIYLDNIKLTYRDNNQ